MKKSLPYLFAALTLITAASCQKEKAASSAENESAAQFSADGASADIVYDDVLSMALEIGGDSASLNQRASGQRIDANAREQRYCAAFTYSGRSFPVTVTVDFGTGCSSKDGISRSGIITYTFTAPLSAAGATASASFTNYLVNGYQLQGIYAISNQSTANAIAFTTSISNGAIAFPNDTSYAYNASKTVTLTGDTSAYSFTTTGNYAISSSYGESLLASVNSPLVQNSGCTYKASGVVGFSYSNASGTVKGTVDYGDGTCDDKAVVSVGLFKQTITLRQ